MSSNYLRKKAPLKVVLGMALLQGCLLFSHLLACIYTFILQLCYPLDAGNVDRNRKRELFL
jgi:RsiW-degrading membrane proteinase PrsW (M82 family)